MKIIADTHTHTLACDHAYSTLLENVSAAGERGLLAIAMTEHTPSIPGAPSWLHFASLVKLPDEMNGVKIIKGAEVNIMDYDGALDLEDKYLSRLEWIIASMHTPTLEPAGIERHTKGWLAMAENPLVDVIGHLGDPRYSFDYDVVLEAFAKYGKIVEINSHSPSARPGSEKSCAEIARRCARLGIPVVVSSDAHHASRVGCFDAALKMLKEVQFPEELVLNADRERFFAAVRAGIARKNKG